MPKVIIAVSASPGRIQERRRMSRQQFIRFWGHPGAVPRRDQGLHQRYF